MLFYVYGYHIYSHIAIVILIVIRYTGIYVNKDLYGDKIQYYGFPIQL